MQASREPSLWGKPFEDKAHGTIPSGTKPTGQSLRGQSPRVKPFEDKAHGSSPSRTKPTGQALRGQSPRVKPFGDKAHGSSPSRTKPTGQALRGQSPRVNPFEDKAHGTSPSRTMPTGQALRGQSLTGSVPLEPSPKLGQCHAATAALFLSALAVCSTQARLSPEPKAQALMQTCTAPQALLLTPAIFKLQAPAATCWRRVPHLCKRLRSRSY